MRRSVFIFLLATNYFLSYAGDTNGPDKKTVYLFSNELNSDPLTGRKYNAIIKGNVLQVLFSEAPFSIEIFRNNDLSHQLQVGIIFPLEDDSFLQELFVSAGSTSTKQNGLFSYRNSPYNNHGMSFKYEIRKFRDNYYYAPQVMFKYCSYDEAVLPALNNGKVMSVKESKFSRIIGIGIMAGRQTYFRKQAIDWYGGIGIRARQMSIKTHDTEYLKMQANNELLSSEEKFNVYPFLNFGFRIGIIVR